MPPRVSGKPQPQADHQQEPGSWPAVTATLSLTLGRRIALCASRGDLAGAGRNRQRVPDCPVDRPGSKSGGSVPAPPYTNDHWKCTGRSADDTT
jgi:hypothetical protein